jgi:hypothetical protein
MSSKLVLTFDTGTTENILNNQYTGTTYGFRQDIDSTNFVLEEISGGTSSGTTGDFLPLSGGTVTGQTIFDVGLSAVTFTGDSIFVTGITANTITTDQLSATTFTGDSIFVTGLTANTITTDQLSATTFTGDSIFVIGLTAETIVTTGLTADTIYTSGLTAETISGITGIFSGLTANTEYIIGQIPNSYISNTSFVGSPARVQIQGNNIFITTQSNNKLEIYDVYNPNNPILISSTTIGSDPRGLYVLGDYVYVVCTNSNTLEIYNISDKSNLILVSSIGTDSYPYDVYAQGKYVYVINQTVLGSLQVFDISDNNNPKFVGSASTDYLSSSIYINDKYAFVCNINSNNVQIFDISNSLNPTLLSTYIPTSSAPLSSKVKDNYLFVSNYSGYLEIVDISNISSPTMVGSISLGSGISNLYIQGNYVYVTYNTFPGRIYVVDISNVTNPILVGTILTSQGPFDLTISGRYLYVINILKELLIYDIGGSYIQQLEAGGILTTTFETLENATIGNDLKIKGGLYVGQSTNIQGDLSSINLNVVSGLTATTISATTYLNLPTTISAATFSSITTNELSANTITATTIDLCSTNGTLYTDSISGCSPINFLSEGNFTQGISATTITANTISATTYLGISLSSTLTIVTYSEITGLTSTGSLIPGNFYMITDADPNLYSGGTNIILQAISYSGLSLQGQGIFYTPPYDKNVVGFNVWYSGGTYIATDKVFWGGYVWENINGNVGTSLDIYTLDLTEWNFIPYDTTNYNVSIDTIEYDYSNDAIIYRKDKYDNEVSTSYGNIVQLINGLTPYPHPIKSFQWGNGSDNPFTSGGTSFNKVYDSVLECINFRGYSISYNTLNTFSVIQNNIFEEFSGGLGFIDYNYLNLSLIESNTFSGLTYIANNNLYNSSNISFNNIYNESYIIQNILYNQGYISYNNLDLQSVIQINFIVNGGINYNNLYNNCYIQENNIEEQGSIGVNILSDFSQISFNKFGKRNEQTSETCFIGHNAIDSFSKINSNVLNDGSVVGYNTGTTNTLIIDNILDSSSIIANLLDTTNLDTNTLKSQSSISYNQFSGSPSYIRFNELSSYGSLIYNTGDTSNIQYNTIYNNSDIGENNLYNGLIDYNDVKNFSFISQNEVNQSSIIQNILDINSIVFSNTGSTSYDLIKNNNLYQNSTIKFNNITSGGITGNTLDQTSSVENNILSSSYIGSNNLFGSQFDFSSGGTINTQFISQIDAKNSYVFFDISSSTTIYGDFTKTIFKNNTQNVRMSYFSGDTLVITDIYN